MKNFKTEGILYLFLVFLLLFLSGCKEPVKLKSKWLDKKIVIDAHDTDWKGYPFYYDEKTHSRIGLYNNDKNLYICFETTDKNIQRQIERRGLYIWFNRTGKEEKGLGIYFPMGRNPRGPGGFSRKSSYMPGPPSGMSTNYRNMRPERRFRHDSASHTGLKILTSENDRGLPCSLKKADEIGIDIRSRIDEMGRFIYELKMPIIETDNTVFIAEASPSDHVGMGFIIAGAKGRPHRGGMERGNFDRGGMDRGGRNMPGGGMGGGDMHGGGMGRRGMGGGATGGTRRRGGNRGKPRNALEIWANVTLASKPVSIH